MTQTPLEKRQVQEEEERTGGEGGRVGERLTTYIILSPSYFSNISVPNQYYSIIIVCGAQQGWDLNLRAIQMVSSKL